MTPVIFARAGRRGLTGRIQGGAEYSALLGAFGRGRRWPSWYLQGRCAGLRLADSRVLARPSTHIEPVGARQIARHYVRELIYGANDGIITTFAVVAGVAGGGLAARVVLIIGAANLLADGLSMAVGNYLSIRAHESVLETQQLPEEEAFPVRHAAATFLAFVVAGLVPLMPYLLVTYPADRFTLSIALTLLALFAVGASRALIASVRWSTAGLEMLGLGAVVAVIAYGCGAVVAAFSS